MNNHKDCTKIGNLRDIRDLQLRIPLLSLHLSLINSRIDRGKEEKEADGHSEREVDTPAHPPNVYL